MTKIICDRCGVTCTSFVKRTISGKGYPCTTLDLCPTCETLFTQTIEGFRYPFYQHTSIGGGNAAWNNLPGTAIKYDPTIGFPTNQL